MDYPKFIVSNQKEESISVQRVNNPEVTGLYSLSLSAVFDTSCSPLCILFTT